LTALPQSGVHNVVNPNMSRKATPTPLQGNITKLQTAKVSDTTFNFLIRFEYDPLGKPNRETGYKLTMT